MRLKPTFTIQQADQGLDSALEILESARDVAITDSKDPRAAYLYGINFAVEKLLPFAVPDLSAALQSTTFWNILQAARDQPMMLRWIVLNELNVQIPALAKAREDLDVLKAYTARPGLPLVYDTNMLNHFNHPDAIDWRKAVRHATGKKASAIRLIVPQEVIGELDRQKYGQGDLARRANAAIRYLDTALLTAPPGEPVQIREGVTIETRLAPPGPAHVIDVDWEILMCADELHHLNPAARVHVLTNDRNMGLRASQLHLPTLTLDNHYRRDHNTCTSACPR
ncbi:PIN domain-containing protein [Streptomyces sp. MJM8645]|uniref:PIN domain-containing protein n=1 Tax=Streptomycetaceae TaxID=2062 RepID=UPI0007AF259A|nr:PIN domain-containing protein [Streptomyces sp. MJM8645]